MNAQFMLAARDQAIAAARAQQATDHLNRTQTDRTNRRAAHILGGIGCVIGFYLVATFASLILLLIIRSPILHDCPPLQR